MSKQETITATEARIPLANLTLSPMNPRQNVTEAEVADMAESLYAAGLIQNLAGYAAEPTGPVEIVAGGRRLRGLMLLAERHADLAETRPDLANPLVVVTTDRAQAEEWANAENVARKALDPADEIRAYGKMEKAGATPAQIARTFAVTEKHVYRRLALAHLPAPVIEALAAQEISLSMAQCFTICDDEKHALEVLDRCRGEAWSDYNLKRELKPQSVKGTDRRAIFVGEDAYKAAGGRIGGDLFAEETLFDDPAILDELFHAKLAQEAERVREAEGWKWADTITESFIGWGEIDSRKCERIYPEQGAVWTEEQAARYDELAELAEAGALDEAGEAEKDALEELESSHYTAEQMAVAGFLAYVDREGSLTVQSGLIAPEDKAAAIEAGVLQAPRHTASDSDKPKSPISAKLADDLARAARGARQHAALRDPDLIFALLAYQLSGRMGYRHAFGLRTEDVANLPTTEGEGYALDERLTAPVEGPKDPWGSDLAKGFRAFRKKGPEFVMAELTRHLASLLSVSDEKLGAVIDKEVSTNAREVWTPTAANFLSRVGGPYLNDLWRDLLGLKEDHPTVTTFARLKKGEKAAKLEALFTDEGTRDALGVTAEQAARIALWTPEGMV